MKYFFAKVLAIVGFVPILYAGNMDYFSITTGQASDMHQKLDAFERGKISLDDLNEKAGADGCRILIGYYFLHTNDISTRVKLPVGRCFAGFGIYPEAIKMAKEYVNIYSNDWRGWRLLGASYASINASNEAVYAYGNAVKYGDKDSYEPLAGEAAQSGQLDVVKGILPQLMALKSDRQISKESRLNLISILLFYSLKTDQKNIFVQTIEGENMKEMLSHDKVRLNITSGCEFFSGADIDKIKQEMKAAIGSEETTNNIPQ